MSPTPAERAREFFAKNPVGNRLQRRKLEVSLAAWLAARDARVREKAMEEAAVVCGDLERQADAEATKIAEQSGGRKIGTAHRVRATAFRDAAFYIKERALAAQTEPPQTEGP